MIDIRGDAKKIVVVLGGAHHNMGVGGSSATPQLLVKKLPLFVFASL